MLVRLAGETRHGRAGAIRFTKKYACTLNNAKEKVRCKLLEERFTLLKGGSTPRNQKQCAEVADIPSYTLLRPATHRTFTQI